MTNFLAGLDKEKLREQQNNNTNYLNGLTKGPSAHDFVVKRYGTLNNDTQAQDEPGFFEGLKSGFAGVFGSQARFGEVNSPFGGDNFRDAAEYFEGIANENPRTKFPNGAELSWDYITDPQGLRYDTGAMLGSSGALGLETAAAAAMVANSPLAAGAAAVGRAFPAVSKLWSSPLGKVVVGNVAQTPMEAISEGGSLVPELKQAGYTDDEIQEITNRAAALNIGGLGLSNLIQSYGAGKLLGLLRNPPGHMGIGEIAKRGALGAAGGSATNFMEEGMQSAIGDIAMNKPIDWQEAGANARTGAATGAVMGAFGGAGGAYVQNRIGNNNKQPSEQPKGINLVGRVRALQGQIPYEAPDGTNCMRTMGVALAGTPYEGQINVDQAVATAQQNDQLMNPDEYTPKAGDLAVVEDGNHIVMMVTENGGTIQNGASHNGIYESDQSAKDMFGGVKYYIRTSDYNNSRAGVGRVDLRSLYSDNNGTDRAIDEMNNNTAHIKLPEREELNFGQNVATDNERLNNYNDEEIAANFADKISRNAAYTDEAVESETVNRGAWNENNQSGNINAGPRRLARKGRDLQRSNVSGVGRNEYLDAIRRRNINNNIDILNIQNQRELANTRRELTDGARRRITNRAADNLLAENTLVERNLPKEYGQFKGRSTPLFHNLLQRTIARRNEQQRNLNNAMRSNTLESLTSRAMRGDHGAKQTFDRLRPEVQRVLLNRHIDRLQAQNDKVEEEAARKMLNEAEKRQAEKDRAQRAQERAETVQAAEEYFRSSDEAPLNAVRREVRATREGIEQALEPILNQLREGMGNGVATIPGREDGRKVRMSRNDKWYQDFYAQHKRKPTKRELLDIAREVYTGRNSHGLPGWEVTQENESYFKQNEANLNELDNYLEIYDELERKFLNEPDSGKKNNEQSKKRTASNATGAVYDADGATAVQAESESSKNAKNLVAALQQEEFERLAKSTDVDKRVIRKSKEELFNIALNDMKNKIQQEFKDPLDNTIYFRPGNTETLNSYTLHLIAGQNKSLEDIRAQRVAGLLLSGETIQNPLAVVRQNNGRKMYLAVYKGDNNMTNGLVIGVEEGQNGRVVTSTITSDKKGDKKAAMREFKKRISSSDEVLYIWEGLAGHSRPSADQQASQSNAELHLSGNNIISQNTAENNEAPHIDAPASQQTSEQERIQSQPEKAAELEAEPSEQAKGRIGEKFNVFDSSADDYAREVEISKIKKVRGNYYYGDNRNATLYKIDDLETGRSDELAAEIENEHRRIDEVRAERQERESKAVSKIDDKSLEKFTKDLTPMQRGNLVKVLSREFNYGGEEGVKTRAGHMRYVLQNGNFVTEKSNERQKEYRVYEGKDGNGTFEIITKAEYDYYNWLKEQQAAKAEKASPKKENSNTASKNESAKKKIEDFGEKIGGARKDVYGAWKDLMRDAEKLDTDAVPLSKSWPEPDYEKLIENGATKGEVAFIRALRDAIPAKPRDGRRVANWSTMVETFRKTANNILTNSDDYKWESAEKFLNDRKVTLNRTVYDILGRAKLYEEVGHKYSLKGIALAAHSYSTFQGKRFDKLKTIWVVEQKTKATAFSSFPRMLAHGETEAEAIENFKKNYENLMNKEAKKKQVTFGLYMERGSKEIYIGKKIGRNVFKIKGDFKTAKEAREYKAEHYDELVERLEKIKEIPLERGDINRPRVGQDMRGGLDVTPEMFTEAFGFRGVEFGNWVENDRRQQDLNNAYDALMDMAAIIDINPKAISLNGELGLAFGARGRGGVNPAAAHYEPDKVVINLTKMNGAGSLGHEWFHALDNMFGRKAKTIYASTSLDVALKHLNPQAEIKTSGELRPEVVDAFAGIRRAILSTDMLKRSGKLDSVRNKDYWTTMPEMSARAFEKYLIEKLKDQNASNDYLANVLPESVYNEAAANGVDKNNSYPYPTDSEMPVIRAAFDNLFGVLEQVPTEKGIMLREDSQNYNAGDIMNVSEEYYQQALFEYPEIKSSERVRKGVQKGIQSTLDFGALPGEIEKTALDEVQGSRKDRKQAGSNGSNFKTVGQQGVSADRRTDTVQVSKTLGIGITRQLVNDGAFSLTGKKVKSLQQLAEYAQVLRHPGYEKFHRVYVNKEGVIIGHETISAMMPSESSALEGKTKYERAEAEDRHIRVTLDPEVDKVYFIHNHPSGNPAPSNADIVVTKELAKNEVGNKFGGHIIIDTTKYTYINKKGDVKERSIPDKKQIKYDVAGKPHKALGHLLNSLDVAARLVKTLDDESKTTVFFTDAKLNVRAVVQLPEGTNRLSVVGLNRYLRLTARNNYSSRALISTADEVVYRKAKKLVENGRLLDVILTKDRYPISARQSIENSGREIAKDKTFFGSSAATSGTKRLMEEQSEYSNTKDLTNTASFKKFFDGSKVVDKNGKPLVVYHGTGNDFNTFDMARSGENYADAEGGFFFTDNKDTAGRYAALATGEMNNPGRVIDAYLSIKNPLSVKAPAAVDSFDYYDMHNAELLSEARANDNDGIIVEGAKRNLYVAFKPAQIKSASENSGSFDVNNPDIRYSVSTQSDQLTPQRIEAWQDKIANTFTNARSIKRNGNSFNVTLPNGNRITIDVVRSIALSNEAQQSARRAHGIDDNANIIATGSNTVLDGNSLMQLLDTSDTGVLDHEVLHAAKRMGLSKKENAALDRIIPSEEAQADDYRAWRSKRINSSRVGKLWQKIVDFAKKLQALLGFENRHNVYRKIESGEVWEREGDRKNTKKNFGTGTQYSVEESQVLTPEEKVAKIVTSTERKGFFKTVKDWIKKQMKEFYTDWIDKNDSLHGFDEALEMSMGRKLQEGEKVYNRVQTLPATAAGMANGLIEGGLEELKVVNERLKNKKLKHLISLKMVLEKVNQETMNKLYPDYLNKNGFNTWIDALGGYLTSVRLNEMSLLHDEAYKQKVDEWKQRKAAHERWEANGSIGVPPQEAIHQEWENFQKELDRAYRKWNKDDKTGPDPREKMRADWLKTHKTLDEPLKTVGKKPEYKPYILPGDLTQADIESVIRNAPKEIKEAAQMYYKFTDNILTVLEDAGLIDAKKHQLLDSKYKYYCPLMRDFSDTAAVDNFISGISNGGRGIGNVSNMIKRIGIEGSSRKVLNPLETTIKTVAVMCNRAERNKVGQMAVELAEKGGLNSVIKKVEGTTADPKNCVFTVMINGKKQAYQTTPELYNSIVGYNQQAASFVLGIAKNTASLLRTGATSSPSFIIKNVLRDTIFAGVSSKNGFIPFVDTVRGMYALARDPRLRAEFKVGGVTAFKQYSSNEVAVKSLDEMAGGKPLKEYGLADFWHAFMKYPIMISEYAEAGTRMGEFLRARANNKSIEQATQEARELTIDFSRSGRLGEKINQIVPFFNAVLQGGDKLIRMFRENPVDTAVKIGCYIVLPSIALWALNHDEDWYKELNPEVKATFWCLPGGIRIPKPQECGILFGSGAEAILDAAFNNDEDAVGNWAKTYLENMTPSILPTVILPIIEWNTGYSLFRDQPIVPKRLENLPDELQYTPTTSAFSRELGGVTGLSPVKIDNTIRGYTGTMGMFLVQQFDWFADDKQNMPYKKISEWPFLRDFTVNQNIQNRNVNDFYDMLDKANKQHAGYGKKGKPSAAVKGVRDAGKLISEAQKDIRELTVDPRLTPEAKRARIDKRKAYIKNVAEKANMRYSRYFED